VWIERIQDGAEQQSANSGLRENERGPRVFACACAVLLFAKLVQASIKRVPEPLRLACHQLAKSRNQDSINNESK
jgi:hypothetical protein